MYGYDTKLKVGLFQRKKGPMGELRRGTVEGAEGQI